MSNQQYQQGTGQQGMGNESMSQRAQAVVSGEPGTTGRDVFEDSTPLGPSPLYGGTQHYKDAAQGTIGSGIGDRPREGLNDEQGGVTGTTGIGQTNAGQTGMTGGGISSAPSQGVGSAYDPTTDTRATRDDSDYSRGSGFDSGVGGGQGGMGQGGMGQGGLGQAGQTGEHHHHHHHHGQQQGGVTDRVGDLNQGGAMYERTGESGPVTTGAAGTDRFDTDGSSTGGGLLSGTGSFNTGQDRTSGQSSGNTFMKSVGTSDKEFTGSERTGGGAYNDTSGVYQGNTSGPGGNSALTGREGNISNNPVAQQQQGSGNKTEQVAQTAEHDGQKQGIFQKIKEML